MSQRECDFRGGRHSFFAFLVYFSHRGDEKDFVCFDHGDTVTFDPTKSKTPATKKWTSDFTILRFRNSISPLPLCRDPCMSSPFSCLCARARAREGGMCGPQNWKNKVAQSLQIGVEFETLHVWLPKKHYKTT